MEKSVTITKKDISKAKDLALNLEQINFVLAKTPKSAIRQRPAKGGGTWNYVSGNYIRKVLNLMFGWDWDFEIVTEFVNIEHGEVVVKGRLTCRTNGKTIVKTQYGNKDIMFRRGTREPLSIGNDMKAAATDALKKCATELGIAQDVYAPQEYKEVRVIESVESEDDKEEAARISAFIKKATTTKELDEIEPFVTDGTLDLFNQKKSELK